jgi:hypothetical protein
MKKWISIITVIKYRGRKRLLLQEIYKKINEVLGELNILRLSQLTQGIQNFQRTRYNEINSKTLLYLGQPTDIVIKKRDVAYSLCQNQITTNTAFYPENPPATLCT